MNHERILLMTRPEICVLISSCDKYSHAWPIFKHAFNKYWPNCPYSIYFITNTLQSPLGITIKTENKNWSDCMIEALSKIPHSIIIFMLEDYWLNQSVYQEGIINLSYFMSISDCEHVRLYVSKGSKLVKRQPYTPFLDRLNKDEDYRASLNAGIWKKSTLLELLEPDKTIWESEHIMTQKSRDRVFCTVKEMKYLVYDVDNNMLERAKFTEHAYQYMKKEGINETNNFTKQ